MVSAQPLEGLETKISHTVHLVYVTPPHYKNPRYHGSGELPWLAILHAFVTHCCWEKLKLSTTPLGEDNYKLVDTLLNSAPCTSSLG